MLYSRATTTSVLFSPITVQIATHIHVHVYSHRNAEGSIASVSPPQKNITAHQNSQHTNSHQPSTCADQVVQPLDTSTPAQKDNTSKIKNSVHLKEELFNREENCVQKKRESPKKPPQSSSDNSGPLWRKARKQLVNTVFFILMHRSLVVFSTL